MEAGADSHDYEIKVLQRVTIYIIRPCAPILSGAYGFNKTTTIQS